MSANNQIVIVKQDEHYNVFHNRCVDNEFFPDHHKPLNIERFNNANEALNFAQEQLQDEDFYVEYGIVFMDLDKKKHNSEYFRTELITLQTEIKKCYEKL